MNNTTLDGHQAPVPTVTTDVVPEEEYISKRLLRGLSATGGESFEDERISERLLREHRVPRVQFYVDLAEAVDPEYMYRRVEEEFLKLGLVVERLADSVAPYETYSRAHFHVSNHRTGRFHMEKLVVVIVEGKFVSITTFP